MQRESFYSLLWHFIFLFLFTNLLGLISYTYMTPETLLWYRELPQSNLTPPDAYFGFVWSVLFFLISLSGTLVWGKVSFLWFKLQLLFVFLWSFSFFFIKSPLLAFYVVIGLLFSEAKVIKIFFSKSKWAASLLIPLLLWTLFAFYLNLYIIVN